MIGSMDDMLQTAGKVVNNTDNGKCSNCGECCGDFLPLSQDDIKRIRKYLSSHKVKDHRNNVVQAGFDFTCPFRDNVKRRCAIYEARPAICREFKCDQTPERIAENKAFFNTRYNVVSMRQLFFGEDTRGDMLGAILGAFAGRTAQKGVEQ